MEYIDGSLKKPTIDDPFYKEWRSTNDVVTSWLINSMEPRVAANFNFLDTVEDVWLGAKELYAEQYNVARMFQLSQKRSNLKKGNSLISEYLGTFKFIWDEMDLYAPLTIDLSQAKKLREQERIFEVLAGLPQDFEHLRSQILMGKELPSLTSVFSLLIEKNREGRPWEFLMMKINSFPMKNKLFLQPRSKENFRTLGQGLMTKDTLFALIARGLVTTRSHARVFMVSQVRP